MDNMQNGQNQQMPPVDGEQKSSFGPMIGIIVIVIILVLGALYFWSAKGPERVNDDLGTVEADLGDVSAMEADIDLGELDTLEAELNAELNAL